MAIEYRSAMQASARQGRKWRAGTEEGHVATYSPLRAPRLVLLVAGIPRLTLLLKPALLMVFAGSSIPISLVVEMVGWRCRHQIERVTLSCAARVCPVAVVLVHPLHISESICMTEHSSLGLQLTIRRRIQSSLACHATLGGSIFKPRL